MKDTIFVWKIKGSCRVSFNVLRVTMALIWWFAGSFQGANSRFILGERRLLFLEFFGRNGRQFYVCMVSAYVPMSLCLYVCLFVCLYVCMSGCLDVRIYVCMYVSKYVCMYALELNYCKTSWITVPKPKIRRRTNLD